MLKAGENMPIDGTACAKVLRQKRPVGSKGGNPVLLISSEQECCGRMSEKWERARACGHMQAMVKI